MANIYGVESPIFKEKPLPEQVKNISTGSVKQCRCDSGHVYPPVFPADCPHPGKGLPGFSGNTGIHICPGRQPPGMGYSPPAAKARQLNGSGQIALLQGFRFFVLNLNTFRSVGNPPDQYPFISSLVKGFWGDFLSIAAMIAFIVLISLSNPPWEVLVVNPFLPPLE